MKISACALDRTLLAPENLHLAFSIEFVCLFILSELEVWKAENFHKRGASRRRIEGAIMDIGDMISSMDEEWYGVFPLDTSRWTVDLGKRILNDEPQPAPEEVAAFAGRGASALLKAVAPIVDAGIRKKAYPAEKLSERQEMYKEAGLASASRQNMFESQHLESGSPTQ